MYGWPFLDVVTYGALISLALEMGQGKGKIPKTPAIFLATGLWFASIMSHVAHGYFQGMMNTVPDTFKICLFLVLLLVVTNSISRLRWVMFVLLLGATFMAIHAIMQERTGEGFAGALPLRFFYAFKDRWVQQSQFFGIFADPNDLGQFLTTCMPLAFALPKRINLFTFAVAAGVVWLLVDGMIATQSRGTLIGVAATVATMMVLWLPAKWLPYLAFIALVCGLVICKLGGGAFLDESARDRVIFWGFGNHYFKSHLLFGGGYGMFGEITGTNRAAHNAFVLCYTEVGYFGYWFWFNLLTLGIIGCWRTRVVFSRPETPSQAYLKRVSGLCIASIVGFAASSFFLSRAYVFPLFFLFAILGSIPMIAQNYLPEDQPPLINFRRDVLLTGTIASLISVLYVYFTIVLLNQVYGA